jgi:glycosyltransferase involved in cell wall biosynthesis
MKRILFARAADASNINAQAKNVQYILRHWRSSEVRPTIFSFYTPDPGVAANPNIDIISVTPDRLWRAKIFVAYMRHFDAVFCPGIHHFADWAALKARVLLGRPLQVVTTVEGLLGVEGEDTLDHGYSEVAGHPVVSQKLPAPEWRRGEALQAMADHIIAISPFLARQARARYGAKVSMLPLGVDVALFRQPTWSRRVRPRVVCAANVGTHKRPHVFLDLAERFPEADFAWFGEGELRQTLIKEAAGKGIANIAFPGPLAPEAVAREFATADVMVLPSRNEGVPKITQEAAASGLAQIVLGFYEAPTVVDGVNGFVVWDDNEMTQRLATLLADRDLIERMGRAGASMAQAWSWQTVAPQWEDRIIAAMQGRSCEMAGSLRASCDDQV